MLIETILAVAGFTFGATLGSFLHVVALRYPKGQSFSGASRSTCPHCDKTLRWYELIPLFSYISQSARCRSCQAVIPVRYPLIELAVGLITLVLIWPLITSSLVTPIALTIVILKLCIISLLTILCIIDADTFMLPDNIILLLTVAVLLYLSLTSSLALPGPYLGMLVGSGFLGTLYLLTRGQGLGLGDVKLMAPLGLMFGPGATAVLLFIAFGAGAAVALYLLATRQATSKTAIPFGPYLCAAAVLLLLFPQITSTLGAFLGFV